MEAGSGIPVKADIERGPRIAYISVSGFPKDSVRIESHTTFRTLGKLPLLYLPVNFLKLYKLEAVFSREVRMGRFAEKFINPLELFPRAGTGS